MGPMGFSIFQERKVADGPGPFQAALSKIEFVQSYRGSPYMAQRSPINVEDYIGPRFCRHFTFVFETRAVSPPWEMGR